jgi:hypothetical protein
MHAASSAAADSHTQSLHSAMTLRVQELCALSSLRAASTSSSHGLFLFARPPIPCHSMPQLTQETFTATVHSTTVVLHQAAAAARFVHVNWALQSSI